MHSQHPDAKERHNRNRDIPHCIELPGIVGAGEAGADD